MCGYFFFCRRYDSTRTVAQAVKDSKGRTLHFMVQRAGSSPDDELVDIEVVPDLSVDGNGVINVLLMCCSCVANVLLMCPLGGTRQEH